MVQQSIDYEEQKKLVLERINIWQEIQVCINISRYLFTTKLGKLFGYQCIAFEPLPIIA